DTVVAELRFLDETPVAREAAEVAPLVVAGLAAGAEAVDQPSVPRGGRLRPWRRQRRARLVQERDGVDRAIDRPHLAADDIGHGLAVERGRHREVGGLRAARVVGLE